MRQRFFAWLARQLWPHLEPAIRAEIARIVVCEQQAPEQQTGTPRRRFIGQP